MSGFGVHVCNICGQMILMNVGNNLGRKYLCRIVMDEIDIVWVD